MGVIEGYASNAPYIYDMNNSLDKIAHLTYRGLRSVYSHDNELWWVCNNGWTSGDWCAGKDVRRPYEDAGVPMKRCMKQVCGHR